MSDKPNVLIYATPSCPYCMAAKSLLRAKGAEFLEVDISGDEAQQEDMIRRTGRRSVPQIFIGARHVGGFDDLSALDQQGKLDALLDVGG